MSVHLGGNVRAPQYTVQLEDGRLVELLGYKFRVVTS